MRAATQASPSRELPKRESPKRESPKRESPKRELPSRDRKGAVLAARALLTRAATAAEYKDRYANSNGVKILYVTTGVGPLVVMIRGYNLSDKPAGEENYDRRLLIGDVAAVIKHLGREKANSALLAPALNNRWDWLDADLTLVTIPNASHFVQQDASQLVSKSIKSGLNR